MATISKILLNSFLLLLLLHWAPPLIKSIKATYENLLEPTTNVGVISLTGCLDDATTHAEHLKKFFEDTDIKAILIKMDCPGGAAGAAQAFFYEMKELKKNSMKPVITWVQSVCMAGGYYVASATDHIIATPAALVGGIGTSLPFIKKCLETTHEQTAMLKALSEHIYHQFTHDIVLQRPKLSLQQAGIWAEGVIVTGAQALELGLIDEVGSRTSAERYIQQKIGSDHEIEWVHPPEKTGLTTLFYDAAYSYSAPLVIK